MKLTLVRLIHHKGFKYAREQACPWMGGSEEKKQGLAGPREYVYCMRRRSKNVIANEQTDASM
jgi:hypothetical protein